MIHAKIARYAYKTDDSAILVEANVKIVPKHIVCLVGGSGVGKTTFVKLLLGLLRC